MDRRSKMAEIKLVSKYYPVANYSYPSPTSPTSSHLDRCSVGSEASTPGLIDDRTDSEVSQEDDYQHGSHATELWDNFWQAGGEWRLEIEEHRTLRQHKSNKPVEISWPLPDRRTNNTTINMRKASPTYSAFPSLKPLPPMPSIVPAPLSPISPAAVSPCAPPPRPRRPEALLTPCLKQPGQNTATWISAAPAMPALGTDNRPKTSSGTTNRPKKSMDSGHVRSRSNVGIHSVVPRRSLEDITKAPSTTHEQPPHVPRHYKSTTYLGAARQLQRQQQLQQQQQQWQQPEPQSVFEDDSDCEESAGISFFRFHKRAASEKSPTTTVAQDSTSLRKGRNRADTIPAPTTKSPAPERERKVDVFGRMLGRRSR
ncbi:hypothetical protein ISF_06048 [Cordyceps fumosorosea ARSEF 2679]|uniref:Uncharacterized protein n=1 Tax=Cordyceps fumosorosea (strain ARSEF 2679) TaxID=1081104 RepID=A0A167SXN9_CORFA|nr:hypothetical protein ISF_06048 [Cordyceps fumosorosea ARSEF 2679]OAA60037.1 hypothetical protein ISF_06048 [Cordyceps fumosorosea ARSEF 2679]